MSSVYYQKPRGTERWTNQPKLPNQACRKVSYRDGHAHECGSATENGATYCTACKRHLITLTDRAPLPDQPAPKPFHWNTDQILPRKRA